MQTILFAFKATIVSQRRKAILAQIKGWDGVHQVGRLDPKTKDADLARIYYIYLTAGADANLLVKRLLALPEIETAEIPAQRGMG